MTKYLVRRVLAWVVVLALLAGAVKFGPALLASARGGSDCLTQYVVPPVTVVVKDLTGSDQEAVWVIKDGDLYLVTRTEALKVCMTGDPENPKIGVE